MTAVALIVAAGRGERLGSSAPKALVALSGRPMLEWSVAALHAADGIGAIVVALPGEALDAAPAGCVAVAGGAQRSHSVRAALAAAPREADVVLVHDAARPLLTPELVERCLRALDEDGGWDAAIAAAPVTDTVKRAADGLRVTETLVRSELWAVQTPQVFRRAALERALVAPGRGAGGGHRRRDARRAGRRQGARRRGAGREPQGDDAGGPAAGVAARWRRVSPRDRPPRRDCRRGR